MGSGLDISNDIFPDEAVKNTQKLGKFQPKNLQRKKSAATSVSSSQAVQIIDSAQDELSEPVRTANPPENCSDAVPDNNEGWHSFMEKSVGENADIFIGLEALGDFLPHATTNMEGAVPPEAVALDVPNLENEGAGPANPVLSSVENLTRTCKVPNDPTYPGQLTDVDPLTTGEITVSCSDGRDHMLERGLRREEKNTVDSINITALTTKSEQASIPTFQQDDVLDLSSLGFTHNFPAEATSGFPSNEESMNLMEMAQLESGISLEGLPEFPAKLTSRRAKTGSDRTHSASDPSPQQQRASTSIQENETGRSLRPRKHKTNLCELVDEDEVLASEDISEECPLSSAIEEETINNEEFQMENELEKKKVKRKSEKTDEDKEKPARKRKNTKEASDKDADAKPKKFSHSTRRRRVDKILLETPEDDIDYQKVPLRDLILLAEHKERQMKKEEAAAGAAVNRSNGNSSCLYDEDDISNQGGEYNDGQGSSGFEDTTVYFNYQTYMDKTPSARWSKQETELFYEAVRQFGTDLSMIQQLFPGRTRRQVKLKYKKEDRQHPLRLREALTNRPKDNSHFQKVIERLQQIAAEENQNADKDGLIDLARNEVADEGISNAGDEAAKNEHIEEEKHEDIANNFIEVQSPLKPDDEEDDFFRWSQYKSDI